MKKKYFFIIFVMEKLGSYFFYKKINFNLFFLNIYNKYYYNATNILIQNTYKKLNKMNFLIKIKTLKL